MAVDKWTITGGDRDGVNVEVVVTDVPYNTVVSMEQLKNAATQQQRLTIVRDAATALRNAVLAKRTIPVALQAAIGYTEEFA